MATWGLRWDVNAIAGNVGTYDDTDLAYRGYMDMMGT